MLAINYSTARENLKSYMDKAVDNDETIIITRKDERNVVMLSQDEYNKLTKRARNAEFLDMIDESIAQIKKGEIVKKTIEELEQMANE
ncbi:MAG: type II toxin-antitoxin system Phd/YefM family antitoxin [Tissierellia bacterium]|nr:type II toxin-antitoxin system Phd/YefM family antitoxin [Tissierellia bacterium]